MSAKEKFCRLLNEAIKDEENAPKLYAELDSALLKIKEQGSFVKHIETMTSRSIKDIANTEKVHKQTLEIIKRYYCQIKG